MASVQEAQVETPWLMVGATPFVLLVIAAAAMEVVLLFSMVLPDWLPAMVGGLPPDLGWGARLRLAIGLISAFSLYIFAWRASQRLSASSGAAFVAGASVVFAVTLLPMYPVTSHDIFAYVMRSHIWVDLHANPFIVPPSAFPFDPLEALVDFPDEPVPHGPMWVLIAAVPTLLGRGSLLHLLFAFKLTSVLGYLADVALLVLLLRRTPYLRGTSALLLFAWNPLVLFELAGNGHNDGIMMAGVLAAFIGLLYRRYLIAPTLLILGVVVKFTVLLLAPLGLLWIWAQPWDLRRKLCTVGAGATLAVAAAALLYVPFWHGLATLTWLDRGKYFTGSVASVAVRLLETHLGSARARVAVGVGAVTIFSGQYVRACRAIGASLPTLLTASQDVIFWYLIVACVWLQPWYVCWLVPLTALMTDQRRAVHMFALCGVVEAIAIVGYAMTSNV